MFENIKLVVADIDGTVTRSDYVTTKRNIAAFQSLRDKGIIIGLASGRPLDDVTEKYKDWNLKEQFDFIIGWNGCQLYDNKTKKSYSYNYLTKNEMKEIVENMEKFQCVVSMYKDGAYLSSQGTDKAYHSAFKSKRQFILASDLSDFYQMDNGGIMFRTTLDKVKQIENEVSKFTKNKNYVGFKTQADLIEFANKDCNKGFALKKYCELYNISLQDCMAFGDTTNDNQMLIACYGVCLKNGSEDTKACAKQITELVCDDDGFADFIERNLL